MSDPASPRACPLPRWPAVARELAARGWQAHHLARLLDQRPSQVHSWLYGQEEMPHHLRRRLELVLGLTPGSLG
jgi:ribosome-binding protein aMBF1 (putative translation factor)